MSDGNVDLLMTDTYILINYVFFYEDHIWRGKASTSTSTIESNNMVMSVRRSEAIERKNYFLIFVMLLLLC